MLTTIYRHAAEFLATAQPFLEAQETFNSLMLGLSLRLKTRGEDQPNFYATVTDGDQVIAAALMTPPNRVIVSSNRNGADLTQIADALHTQGWSVSGTVGAALTAKAFAEIWTHLTHCDYRIRLQDRLFDLAAVIPPPPINGSLRMASAADMATCVDWGVAFDQEAMNGSITADVARANFNAKVANQELFLWEDAGQPVTMAARTRATRHTMSIAWVYTPPAHRRRGYASACVAALSQLILNSGYTYCVLFADVANPTSNSIYQKIGYRPVADFDDYRFVDNQAGQP